MDTQQIAKNILIKLYKESKFSGVDQYPIEISEIQDELKFNDVEIKEAIDLLYNKGLISYRAVGDLMIQLTEKGISLLKK